LTSSQPEKAALVTGAAGFLGLRITAKLLQAGTSVKALVRPNADTPPALAELQSAWPGRIDVLKIGFLDDRLPGALQGVGTLYHVAASTAGSAASQVANNSVGSEALFLAALAVGVPRVVLVSSLGVVESASLPAWAVVDESAGLEKHPEWRDPYTFAKHRQETLAWRFAKENKLPLVVVRPGPILGPGHSPLITRVGVSLGGVFLHLGGGNPIPFTNVENCADAVILAGTVPGVEGNAFCIVDDDLPTSRQVLRRYRRAVKRIPVLPVPRLALKVGSRFNQWYSAKTGNFFPPVFTPYKVAAVWKPQRFSNELAKRVLGWRPRISMDETLETSTTSR
jgi:nucleoside-diphosphate-sugar epimerase